MNAPRTIVPSGLPIARVLVFIALLAVSGLTREAIGQTGACCVGTSCTIRTFSACDDIGGDWLGPGVSCSGSPCAPATGTCCTGTTCTLRTSAQCSSVGGSFLGGSSCSPNPCSGSCCLNGTCSITAFSTCSTSGGSWLRFGSCSPNICPGPCCDNGVCTVTVQSLCVSPGAWTPGGTCNPNSCLPPQCEAEITGNIGGSVTAVARIGTSGVLAARGATLEVYNAVNAAAPAPFSPPRRLLLEAPAVEIATSPGAARAFVLMENSDITYVTIATSPQLLVTAPQTIGGLGVTDIEADGDRVYIPRNRQELHGVSAEVFIYDRGGDNLPVQRGRIDPLLQNFEIGRVVKIGSILWLGMHEHQSSVYAIEGWNVSDPAAPVHVASSVGFATVPTRISTMQAVGNRLHITFKTVVGSSFSEDWLRAADVSNPSSPVWHPAVDLNGTALSASVTGNHLRLGFSSSMQTWDVSNPGSLSLLGTLTNSTPALQISAGASNDYVAAGRFGLRTVSFTVPASPLVQSTLGTVSAEPGRVRQIGNSTVAYDAAAGLLQVFDLTRPDGQQLLGSTAATIVYFGGLEVTRVDSGASLVACLGDSVGGDIDLIEITNPAAPVLRNTIDANGWRFATSGSRLYVLTNQSELRVYDISNPSTPTLLSTTPYGGDRTDYACMTAWDVGSTRALALGGTFGLWLINASNGASPQVRSVHAPIIGYRAAGVAKGAQFLYVSGASGPPVFDQRLDVLDVGNLGAPVIRYASGDSIGAGNAGVYSSLAYVDSPAGRLLVGLGEFGRDLTLFDLNGPQGEHVPYRVDVLPTQTVAPEFAVNASGTKLVLAVGGGGLQQVSLPTTWFPGFSSPFTQTRAACLGGSISISVDAHSNPDVLTYHWFRAGLPDVGLNDGLTPHGTIISGSNTPTLMLSNLHAQDAGTRYFCRVTNGCGTSSGARITLSICIADINCSGSLTVQDIFDFLAAYFAGNLLADVNGSGSLTVQDIFDFLEAYFGQCAD